MPILYSAPASFLAIPVEGVFRQIKLVDFRITKLPADFRVKGTKICTLSKKEDLLAQISCFIIRMSISQLKQIFYMRFKILIIK